MGLKEVFDEAAEKAKALPSATNDDMLELYKNFKQANAGDCNTGRLTSDLALLMTGNLTGTRGRSTGRDVQYEGESQVGCVELGQGNHQGGRYEGVCCQGRLNGRYFAR